MTNKQYLIDTLRYTRGWDRPELKQSWEHTCNTLAEAKQIFDAMGDDQTVIAAAIVEFAPGDAVQSAPIRHGSFADRSCSGGVPIAVVIEHGARSSCLMPDKNNYTSLPDWDICTDRIPVSSSPAPGYKLKPKEITARQKQLMQRRETTPVNEGRFLVQWTDGGIRCSRVFSNAWEFFARYSKKWSDVQITKIEYSESDHALLAMLANSSCRHSI